MNTNQEAHMRITQEAAQWFMELQTEGSACYEAFDQWLRRSPEHIEEFLAVSSVSLTLDQIDPQRRIDIQELLAQAQASVIPLHSSTVDADNYIMARARSRGRWSRRLAVAAAILGAVMLLPLLTLRPDTYATRIGEQRTFRLDDGSVIALNTQSRVAVNFTRSVREVQLLDGEAMFSVEHDATRPFRVLSGDATVQAIGTQFNVYHSARSTTVLVVEGTVQVSANSPAAMTSPPTAEAAVASGHSPSAVASLRVSAGEQADVLAGHVQKKAQPDLQNMIAWRERKLIFHDKPLTQVVAEFNRYNSVRFEIGPNVVDEPLSGVFVADRPESLALFLQRVGSVDIQRHSDRFVISAKHHEN